MTQQLPSKLMPNTSFAAGFNSTKFNAEKANVQPTELQVRQLNFSIFSGVSVPMSFNRQHPLTLSLISAGLCTAFGISGQAHAQQSQASNVALESIIVTGTRTNNRTAADSLSPIDQLSAKDLTSAGSTELATVLATLLPALNFPRPSVADLADAVRPAQLRGLSPNHTLVLINGKRRHTSAVLSASGLEGGGSAPVDLNAIPLAAIERIEVLRDGAAAQYGSDAIAGVINIILKSGAKSGNAETSYGKTSAGDGAQTKLGASVGINLTEQGWLRIGAETRDQAPTNRALPDFRDPREPLYGKVSQRFGEPDTQQSVLFVNGQLRLNESVDAYAFGSYGNRDTHSPGFYRPALGTRNILSIYPQGFLPVEASNTTDQSLVVGLRGTTPDGWRWDTSVNHGSNKFDLNIENSLNLSLGASSPTRFYDGTLKNSQNLLNVDVAKDFDVSGLSGPLNVAWGLEARQETYAISPGEPNSYVGSGAQVFGGFTPGDSGTHSRNNKAVYLNLEAEATKKFSGSVALRTEQFSDFGSATSAKLATRYVFVPEAALRATVSTGFRAPSLAQQYYSTTTTVFIDSVARDIRTFRVSDPVAKQLGAEDLRPEKSNNLSLGLLLQPSKAFTTTVDLYQIKIKDRIVLSEYLYGTPVVNFLVAHGFNDTGGGAYFTNAIDTTTRGLDVVSTYRLNLANQTKLDLSLGYNQNKTSIDYVAPNPDILAKNGLEVQRIGRVQTGLITKGSPANKITLGADYSATNWSAHGQLTRYGEFTAFDGSNPALDQTFSVNWVLNLSSSYKIAQWTLTGGIDNVTDAYPDRLLTAKTPNTTLPYSEASPYGFSGRFSYVKVAYAW